MAHLASHSLLRRLKSLYPLDSTAHQTDVQRIVYNPWYLVAAVAFNGSNKPDTIPVILQYVLDELNDLGDTVQHADRLQVARRTREAVFQSGLLCGYARTINSLVALQSATPQELQETSPLRDVNKPMQDYAELGKDLFRRMYGSNADSVQQLLDKIYPDMGWFSNTIGYGLTYGSTNVMKPFETSYILATANIIVDTPRQIVWHFKTARNGGATLEQVKAVRQIAMEVGTAAGLKWSNPVPEVDEEAQ
ncbi:hypothetical protein K474DRAFT_1619887 [Panus rudis PR-1116 ss-1]|nr:hypothetical protein K474DRAFT_1619887 [Panus rudis PR-1116 ss-1]